MNTPTRTALNTVNIEPLVKIESRKKVHPRLDGHDNAVTVCDATCRDCGPLAPLVKYPTLSHATMVKQRHLAEHLTALAAEVAEASR